MKRFLILSLFLGLLLPATSVLAEKEVGEGYARPSYKELAQTLVLMGGFNIKDPKVTDEYARLIYCNMYKKNFENDIAWSKIRGRIIARAAEKKEYYRVLYETTGVFELGRYNFETQTFPLTPNTALKNVGTIALFSIQEAQPYCGAKRMIFLFPPNIDMELNRTLTIDKIFIPMEKVEKILARIDESSDKKKRRVYGRIRMHVTDATGLVQLKGFPERSVLKGDVKYVDFFIDPEMTKPIGGVQIVR